MKLLTRLQHSYTVQEQEAGDRIGQLEEVLVTIRDLLTSQLIDPSETIISIIDKVLIDGSD